MNEMSKVELFFYATQQRLGGNLRWDELPLPMQLQYVDACNFIIDAGSFRKENANGNS